MRMSGNGVPFKNDCKKRVREGACRTEMQHGQDRYVNCQPTSFPRDETEASLERKRLTLEKIVEGGGDRNDDSTELLKVTYVLQRRDINSGMPIKEVLSKWSIFTKPHHFCTHCDLLIGDGSLAMFEKQLLDTGMRVYKYFQDCPDNGDLSLLTQIAAEANGSDSILRGKYTLYAGRKRLFEVQSLMHSIFFLLSCYYVFNMEHPEKADGTLEYIRREGENGMAGRAWTKHGAYLSCRHYLMLRIYIPWIREVPSIPASTRHLVMIAGPSILRSARQRCRRGHRTSESRWPSRTPKIVPAEVSPRT
ncbi:unnamed protein product [Darwinula stevensoni]|uniref:Uncharacterized protein n=1 Tax=Darwinula stevensoni TaxID=69355 RepID=A0A7R8XB52_9CRUS|nr:unnamed protein product [Darwinula stevensoni]CAG0892520.1 unnamed protein product [Darwinula stevensoni]